MIISFTLNSSFFSACKLDKNPNEKTNKMNLKTSLNSVFFAVITSSFTKTFIKLFAKIVKLCKTTIKK
jgi:hypothetical protein